MRLTIGVAVLLGTVQVVLAYGSHWYLPRQVSSISRSFTGVSYPTGPGFDVSPLASITKNSAPEPTVALPVVFPPGSLPLPLGNGAFVLPDLSTPRQIPPTNSPEVQAWLSEIAGVTIPDFSPTKDGTCNSDPAAAAQAGADGRCWWTCTGCTRDTDVVGCPDIERWGLTFDDGPSEYTPKLLTYLQSIDTQATFYMVGSRVVSNPATVQTQLMLGHELSVHTWSHPSMTTLTKEQIVAELGWARKAIKDVTGVTPLTFRPPFGDIDGRVRTIANAMNLTPVIWSNVGTGKANTEDFEVPDGSSTAAETVNQFRNALDIVESSFDTGIITLEHDLFQETVDLAIGSTLPDALSRPGPEQRGWKLGTVAQCSGQRPGDSYRETTTNQTVLARLRRPIPGVTTLLIDPVTSVSEISTVVPTGSSEDGVISTPSTSPITAATPAAPLDFSQVPTTVTGATTSLSLASSLPAEASPPSNESSAVEESTVVPSYILPTETESFRPSTATFENVDSVLGPGKYPLQNALAPTSDGVSSTVQSGVSRLPSTASASSFGSAQSSSPLSFDIKGAASYNRVASMKGCIIPFSSLLVFTLL